MKKIICFILIVMAPFIASAQTITAENPTADDCVAMLQQFGYECYPFTIPDKYVKKEATYVIKEFDNHKEVESKELDFPISFDIQTARMSVNFAPTQGDSLRRCGIRWDASLAFNLKNKYLITDDEYSSMPYKYYGTVARKGNLKFKEDEFIPLVLYGSAYQLTDKHSGKHYYKFCGSYEDLVEMSPHYYLIGIKILK